ncbi:hypothetical protein AB1Y20_016189 [Prymnesium parvum]|uniref:FACT complex subunit SSRP1 n=1 Tax=Prymnesium parvum TaxID=97485 RepID=A0AB34IC33_PRYPA
MEQLADVVAERDALRAQLAAVTAERDALLARVEGGERAAAQPAAGGASGAQLAELSAEVSFLSPRGKFRLVWSEAAAFLHGKTSSLQLPYHLISRLFMLPEATGKGTILALTLSSPIANGNSKLSHLLLHSKPSDPKCAAEALQLQPGPPAEVVSQAFARLVPIAVSGPSSFKPLQGVGGVACYVKATEAALYFLEEECVVREASKLHVLPYANIRVEVVPPDSRRTFDLLFQLPADGSPAAKPQRLELSMLPAAECERIGQLLLHKKVNVNGSRDGGAESSEAPAASAQVEKDSEDDEDDSDDDEEDYAPSDSSAVEEEYDSDGGIQMEGSPADDESEAESEAESGGENGVGEEGRNDTLKAEQLNAKRAKR